jgi:hypothetical protein
MSTELLHDLKPDEPASARSPRRFSPALTQALQGSMEPLGKNGSQLADAWYAKTAELLRNAISEAGFLGYPRVAKLGRAIHNAMPPIQRRADGNGPTALRESLDLLMHMCRAPEDSAQLDIATTLALLQSAAAVPLRDLLVPIQTFRLRDADAFTATENAADGTRVAHHDSSIYSNAVIDALDQCAEEESWTVAQLASVAEDLACSTDKLRAANRLMSVLRGHRFFRRVDRVCMAGFVRGSNQLVVVDSCISPRLRSYRDENPMQRGYSCFVNPQGSLFRMKPGVLRVFDDCSRVLDSFARQGKPAQRSIAHIADTGLRSGLCLAIGRGETVQGFLFMNSLDPNLFADVTTRFAPLLSLFSLLGTIAFDASGFHAEGWSVNLDAHLPAHSVEFSTKEFRELLQTTVRLDSGVDLEVHITTDELPRFLYLPSTVIRIVAKLLEHTGYGRSLHRVDLHVGCRGEQVTLHLTVPGLAEDEASLRLPQIERAIVRCRREFRACPVDLETDRNGVVIAFPIEPIFDAVNACAYSVAY